MGSVYTRLKAAVARRRLALALVTPVAAGTAVLVVIALAGVSGTASTSSRHLLPATTAVAGRPNSSQVAARSLPHHSQATDGRVPFGAAPPKRSARSGSHSIVGGTGVPAIAVAAYGHAASLLASSDAACRLSWADLAGIGRVESDNGLTWGAQARVTANGTLVPPIIGPALNGQDGFPAVPTTDGGRLEHDPVWAHAVGPMQFLPSTWLAYAQDGNGDGVKDPQNFYDAALTAGVYLCDSGGDLATPGGLSQAVFAYNHSDSYVALVVAWIGYYRQAGVAALLAAGSGLLPVGSTPAGPGQGRGSGPGAHKPKGSPSPRRRPPPPTPEEIVVGAAGAAEHAGSFGFSMTAELSGTPVASGSGVVSVATGSGALQLTLAGYGACRVRVFGSTGYVSLPPGLASRVGAVSQWVLLSPLLLQRLPPDVAQGLSFASDDLVVVIAQLEGATPATRVAGSDVLDGSALKLYSGPLDLQVAMTRDPAAAPALDRVAAALGAGVLSATTGIDNGGHVRSLELSLGSIVAGLGPVTSAMVLGDYGRLVALGVPPVSPLGKPSPASEPSGTSARSALWITVRERVARVIAT